MAEEKTQVALTPEQMMQMISMLQQQQPQQPQNSFAPVATGWGQSPTGLLNFAQVMQSLQSVIVELSMECGNGKASIFLSFPKEYGASVQTLQALVNTLEANNVPVKMWRQSFNKGGR